MDRKQEKGLNLDELQSEVEKLLELLKDRQPGLPTWNSFLTERLTNIQNIISQTLGQQLPENWVKLLLKGWKIVPCSCMCGGDWAWLKTRPSGAMETHGCVCHETPR